jgi:GGDEF domain-containing protein
MWPLLYLSMFNVGIGFSVALIVYRRHRYVQSMVARGYDLRRLSPQSRFRDVCRRFGWRVQVDKVCRRLGNPIAVQSPNNSMIGTTEGADSTIDEMRKETANDDAVDNRGADEETAGEGRRQFTNVQCLDSATSESRVNVGFTGDDVLATTPPKELGVEKKSTLVGGSSKSWEDRQSFLNAGCLDGDFFQRAAAIDQMLRDIQEEPDPDQHPNLPAVIAEFQGMHQWWTTFEGSLSSSLPPKSSVPNHEEKQAQVEDDLVAMQASLTECENLVAAATKASDLSRASNEGRTGNATFSRNVHQCLIAATRACHRLRDNFALLTPESPLPYGSVALGSVAERSPRAMVPTLGLKGLEKVLADWNLELAKGVSPNASLVLFDVDRTAHWNSQFGLESVDRTLAICHRQLAESVRSNRGFDRVIRISGQQYLLFLGLTSPEQAKFAAERIRQVFANTSWHEDGQKFVIHLSGSVAAYTPSQPIVAQIAELRSGLPEAKRFGGNAVVEQVQPGEFQKISGVPSYSSPARHHDQPLEKWNPKASVTC